MSIHILATALTLATPAAQAAPAIEVGVGVSEVFEERKPSAMVRLGFGAVTGELAGTYNPHTGTSQLTQILATISGQPWPEDVERWKIKALADLSLPAQDSGWYGAPHLYLGLQGALVERTLATLEGDAPINFVQADPPSWHLSPLLGVGVSGSFGPITARVTMHSTLAQEIWDNGRSFNHTGSLDLLYRF
jgi:hypothetical protein